MDNIQHVLSEDIPNENGQELEKLNNDCNGGPSWTAIVESGTKSKGTWDREGEKTPLNNRAVDDLLSMVFGDENRWRDSIRRELSRHRMALLRFCKIDLALLCSSCILELMLVGRSNELLDWNFFEKEHGQDVEVLRSKAETQVVTFRDKSVNHDTIVVCFKGTQLFSTDDWCSDVICLGSSSPISERFIAVFSKAKFIVASHSLGSALVVLFSVILFLPQGVLSGENAKSLYVRSTKSRG
ncbi:hypothetical protein V6N13_032679 [Hibiscus sabdariffa]